MTGHMTSRYQGLNSSEVGAKIENLGTRLAVEFRVASVPLPTVYHGGRRRHEIRQGSNNFLSLVRNITKLPHRMEFDIPENPMFFVFRYCYILAGK